MQTGSYFMNAVPTNIMMGGILSQQPAEVARGVSA